MSTTPEQPEQGDTAGPLGPSAMERILADPALRSRDDDGVVAIAVGTTLWAFALIGLLVFGSHLTGIDVPRWTLVCLFGAGLGIPGLAIVLARRRRLRRAAAIDQG